MPLGNWTELFEVNKLPSLAPLISIMVMSTAMMLYGVHSGRLRRSRPFQSFYGVLGRFLHAAPATTLVVSLSVVWLLACLAVFVIIVLSMAPSTPLSMDEILQILNHKQTFVDTVNDAMSWAFGILVAGVMFGPFFISVILFPAFAIRGFLGTTRLRAWITSIVLNGVTIVVLLPVGFWLQQVPLSSSEKNIANVLRIVKVVSGSFKEKNGRYGSLLELRDFSQAAVRAHGGDQSAITSQADRGVLEAHKELIELNLQTETTGYLISFHRSRRFAYVDATPLRYSSETRESFVLDCALGLVHVSDRKGAPATILDQILQVTP